MFYSGAKSQTSAGLLPDIKLPAHYHGRENQTPSLLGKHIPRGQQSVHSRSKGEQAQLCTGEGLTCQAWCHSRSLRWWCLSSSLCCCSDTEKLQPLHLPLSRGTAGPCWGPGAAAASPSSAVQSLPTPLAVLAGAAPSSVPSSGPSTTCGAQTVEPQALGPALGLPGTFHSSGRSGVVQWNHFLSAPLKCLNTKALPIVLSCF